MNKNYLRNGLGGGGGSKTLNSQIAGVDSKNQSTKSLSKSAKALIAIGLASLLPSFACANESVENLKKVLENQDRDSQKVKKLDDDSPVVGLRSSSLGREVFLPNGNELFPFTRDPSNKNLQVEIDSLKSSVIISQNTTIGSLTNDNDPDKSGRWNVTTNRQATIVSRDITIENGATLTINAQNHGWGGYRFAIAGVILEGKASDGREVGNLDMPNILWQGGTINIDFKKAGYGGSNNSRGAMTVDGKDSTFTITSNLIFKYTDDSNNNQDYFDSGNVSAVAAVGEGVFKLLGDEIKIEINQFPSGTSDNRNYGLGGFALYASSSNGNPVGGTIYLNAKDDGTVNKKNATVQVIGGISTSHKDSMNDIKYNSGKIYAHFTGKDSWLKGNVYAGRYDTDQEFSTLKMSFTGGATMAGNIVFSGDTEGSISEILFDNTSEFKGKILDLGRGKHQVIFDNTIFTGSVKRDDSETELKSIGVIKISNVPQASNGIQISQSGTSNTTITLKNQAQWNVNEKSTIHHLVMEGGTVNFDTGSDGSTIATLTTNSGTNTLNLNQGGATITSKITATGGASNTFVIGNGTANVTLALTNGFETNGGTNAFVINAKGALDLGTQLDNGLKTANGTTSFTFNESADTSILGGAGGNKTITANAGGTNIINTAANLNLGDITTNDNGINNITLRGTASTTSMTVGVISGAMTGKNNFTLDSSEGGETKLTLNGANANFISTLTALGEGSAVTNTLLINSSSLNNINELVLGSEKQVLADVKTGSLTIDNQGGILGINTLTANATSSLALSGKYDDVRTLTLKDQSTLNLDVSKVVSSNNVLTITDFSNLGKATLNLTGGKATITNKVKAGNNISNTFEVGDGATLTLNEGFTNTGGTNAFVINTNGTLSFGASDPLKNGLKTTNGGTTSFTIKDKANFSLNGKDVIAESGGTNIIESGGAITLGAITADGKNDKGNSSNKITINSGKLTLSSTITSINSGENYFVIGNGADSASLELNTSKITTSTGGKTSFTVESGSTLTLTGGVGSTLKADNAFNEFTIKSGAIIGGNKFYDTIIATNGGNNIIDTSIDLDLKSVTADGGTNKIALRGATMNIAGAISGNGNDFILDSTTSQPASLILKDKNNTINTLTALSENVSSMNTLTIENTADGTNSIKHLVLGDNTPSPNKEGHLNIANSGNALGINTITANATSSLALSGKYGAIGTLTLADGATLNLDASGVKGDDGQTTTALIINTFTGNAGSTLTISTGNVGITNALIGENNNITLDGATLTLNNANGDSTIANLTTTGANTINFNKGNTTINSEITTDGTNDFNLTGTTGKKTSATFKSNISGNGTNSFKLDSATLHLQGYNNAITTLTLGQGKNNVINLAGDRDKNNGAESRTDFRLLTIGTNQQSAGLIGNKGTTLTFESYIDPFASQSNAKLGETAVSNGQGTYGYAYSDRVIIHNVKDNTAPAEGSYKFNVYYSSSTSGKKLNGDKYTEGGTEVKGNIALFTVAKTTNGSNEGVIKFDKMTSITTSEFDNIITTLTRVETDENGRTKQTDGTELTNKKYFTYFVDKIIATDNEDWIDDGSGGNGGSITRDANLMIQSMAVSAVNLYLANFNSLNKRMGELRDNAYSKGVWARTFIGSQSNDFGLSDRTGYFSLQAGFDGTIKTEKANNFIGVAVSYSKNFGYSGTKDSARDSKSKTKLGIGSLNSQLLELALYNSYVSNEGWYNDTIGKFSYIQNSMTVKDQRGANVGGINGTIGELNTFALTLSNEVGYRAKLGEDKAWFIDPQAELALGHINGVNFSLNQTTATISSAINLRARAGASIGYDFKNFTQDKGIDAKVYVGAFYEMDSFHYTDGSKGIKYTTGGGVKRSVEMIDFDQRAVLNLGTNLTIKDATRLYLDFEKSFGGKITTNYKINAGVRYSFGEALSEKGKEVLKDKEGESVDSEAKAPLKLEKGDK